MREYLLTCENVSNYGEAVRRLRRLPRRVTLRIPIQWNDDEGHIDDPNDYVNAFRALSAVADVMIQFADSSAMKHFTPRSFDHHVKECLSVLGSFCKSAEAGNEVNGNWLGDRTAEKVQRALTACSHTNLHTVVTYYLSADQPRQMFDWIARHPLRSNYALISHYPNTTPDSSADPLNVFAEFSRAFPNSTVGWGEYGTEDADDNNTASMDERARLVRLVEREWWELIAPRVGNYAGLGGYWDWATDSALDQTFGEVWA